MAKGGKQSYGPWFAVRVGTVRDPGIVQLGRLLGVSRLEALGIHVGLSDWTMRYRGDTGRLRPTDLPAIEDDLAWSGAPGALVEALVAADMLERKGDAHVVAGWKDTNGSHIAAARKREQRRRKSGAGVQGQTPDSRAPVRGNGTQRNGTERNGTKPKNSGARASPGARSTPAADGGRAPRPVPTHPAVAAQARAGKEPLAHEPDAGLKARALSRSLVIAQETDRDPGDCYAEALAGLRAAVTEPEAVAS